MSQHSTLSLVIPAKNEQENISRIREIEPHVLWFPAQCAETYSYTLSLALQLGLPVVASHIGAFPERLAGRNSSVLFSDFHSSPAWAAFWRDAVGDFDLILKSSVPDHLFAPSDEEFYERRYLEGLVASKDAPVLPMYFMGECLAIGNIPSLKVVLHQLHQGLPVILEEQSDAGQAYEDAVARLLGEEREHRFMTSQKKGFFSRMFKGG